MTRGQLAQSSAGWGTRWRKPTASFATIWSNYRIPYTFSISTKPVRSRSTTSSPGERRCLDRPTWAGRCLPRTPHITLVRTAPRRRARLLCIQDPTAPPLVFLLEHVLPRVWVETREQELRGAGCDAAGPTACGSASAPGPVFADRLCPPPAQNPPRGRPKSCWPQKTQRLRRSRCGAPAGPPCLNSAQTAARGRRTAASPPTS
jgi:hypothetical protein